MAAAVLQTRITAILDVLTKAAVAEISQLIQDDSAVYHREMKRREDEIEGLKKRLQVTEKELKKVQATVLARCSVGVQVETLATGQCGGVYYISRSHISGLLHDKPGLLQQS